MGSPVVMGRGERLFWKWCARLLTAAFVFFLIYEEKWAALGALMALMLLILLMNRPARNRA